MFLYQVGKVVLRGLINHDTSLRWRGEAIQSSQSSKTIFTNFYSLPDVTRASVSGVLTASEGDTISSQRRLLEKLGGVPYVDVIGYTYNEDCGCVDWWYTYGQITSMSRSEDGEVPTTLQAEIDIELDLNPQWIPLPPLVWYAYYGKDVLDTALLQNLTWTSASDALENQPCDVIPWHFKPNFTWYKRTYNTNFLTFPYGSDACENWDSPYKGLFSGVQTVSPHSATANNPYGADTDTLYVFRKTGSGVPNTSITITVESELTPGSLITHVSTLDLGALHTTLLTAEYGATGLTTDFRIVCANNDAAPSFVLNASGVVVTSNITGEVLTPDWSYVYRCPGELIGYRNEISIAFTNASPSQIECWYRHIYRTL